MTLVRVYCGLASAQGSDAPAAAGTSLTAAVVDDAGRLLDICRISDDPLGYARIAALLAERSNGSSGVAIAADSDEPLITGLFAAAGRPLAFADDESVDDYAERFADDESSEEIQAPSDERQAVGLARALQAGALSAVAVPAPRELSGYTPVLAAHAALINGRQAAAVALREVLRELYPAALRAYPDPAEPVCLAVLDALPEPGMVGGRSRDTSGEAIAGRLAAEGVADAGTLTEALTALQVAVSETPRRGGLNKSLGAAVADTVRQAVAAVRCCDTACVTLVDALNTRPSSSARRAAPSRRAGRAEVPTQSRGTAAVSPTGWTDTAASREDQRTGGTSYAGAGAAPGRRGAEPHAAQPPARTGNPLPRRDRQQPAAAAADAVGTPPAVGQRSAPAGPPGVRVPTPPPLRRPSGSPMVGPASSPPARPSAPAAATPGGRGDRPTIRPVSAAMPPAPELSPIVPAQRANVPPADAGEPFRAPLTTAAINNARAERQRAVDARRPADHNGASAPDPGTGSNGVPPHPGELGLPVQNGASGPNGAGIGAGRAHIGAAARNGATPRNGAAAQNGGPSTNGIDAPPPPGIKAVDVSIPMPIAGQSPAEPPPPPGSRANWPLVNSDDRSRQGEAVADTGRIKPPWQADDLPPEPPALRLVEPATPPQQRTGRAPTVDSGDALGADPLNANGSRPDSPPLRLVDADIRGADARGPGDRSGSGLPRRTAEDLPRRAPEDLPRGPVAEEGDGDLLIFAATRSAWFVGEDGGDGLEWTTQADDGWRAAEQAAQPAVGAETNAGLPKRVPQANLVPGSPQREERPLRIVRDPASIAAHTTGYFRGWRRGQEIGGYAVGGRPGREAAGGWDFSRDGGEADDDREYDYRQASYRS